MQSLVCSPFEKSRKIDVTGFSKLDKRRRFIHFHQYEISIAFEDGVDERTAFQGFYDATTFTEQGLDILLCLLLDVIARNI